MSSKKKNIDQYIAGKIGNTMPPVGDADWNAILKGIPSTPVKKRMAWWWWLLIPALLLPGAWYLYSSIAENNQTPNPEIISEYHTSDNTQEPQALSDSDQDKSASLTDAGMETEKPEVSSENATQGAEKNVGSESARNSTPDKKIRKSSEFGANKGNSRAAENEMASNPEVKDQEIPQNSDSRIEKIPLFPRLKVVLRTTGSPWEPILEELIKPIHPFVNKNPDQPNLRKPGWSIGAYTAISRFSQMHTSANANYQSYRNAAESPSTSMEGGFIAQYNTGKWVYTSGAIYSPKTQWLKGQIRFMIYDSFPHLDPQGNVIGYFRLNYRDTLASLEQRVTHTFMDIPVQIGREIPLGKKSSLIPSAGMTMSFLSGKSGQSIGTDLSLHNVSDASIFAYRKSMQSLQAEIKYRYYIKPGLSFNTGLQYKHGVSSLLQDASVQQKFRQMGCLFEFQYQF